MYIIHSVPEIVLGKETGKQAENCWMYHWQAVEEKCKFYQRVIYILWEVLGLFTVYNDQHMTFGKEGPAYPVGHLGTWQSQLSNYPSKGTTVYTHRKERVLTAQGAAH